VFFGEAKSEVKSRSGIVAMENTTGKLIMDGPKGIIVGFKWSPGAFMLDPCNWFTSCVLRKAEKRSAEMRKYCGNEEHDW